MPSRTVLPSTLPVAPLPVGESNSSTLLRSRLRSFAARTIGVGERMLAGALDAGGKPQDLASRRNPPAATIATTFGLPSVSVPVLSTTSVSIFSIRSSASAFLISTPACAPRPTPTMIDIGVASPSAQGQAMISTLTAATRPNAIRGSGPNNAQTPKAMQRDDDHRRHEPAGDLVGEPLDRRARALRLRDHLDDLRKQGVAPDLLGAHDEAAGLVERARDHLAAGLLGDRHGFAGHQGFIERRAALEDDAVHRHFFSRPDAQSVADLEAVDLNLVVGAVVADATRGFRRQFEQRLDRAGRRLAGAQLQHLAEQDEHGDDGGGLEIDRNRAAMSAKSWPGRHRGATVPTML